MKKIIIILSLILNGTAAAESTSMDSGSLTLDWTGPYIGINAGYISSYSDYTFNGDVAGQPFNDFGSATSGGAIGGIQAGYNWSVAPNFLLGIEADINFSDVKNTASLSRDRPINGFSTLSVDSTVKNLGTIRGRVGYTVDDILFFASGGYAYGSVDLNVNAGSSTGQTSLIGSGNQIVSGWAAGAGVEYRVSKALALRAEYLYMDFGKTSLYSKNGTPTRPLTVQLSDQQHVNIFRIGLNYIW